MPDLATSNIVNVNITRQTQLPSAPGFGRLCIVAPSSTGVITLGERARIYSSIDGVAADFATTTEEYKAAAAYFSQSPRPVDLMIAVRDTGEAIADEMNLIVDNNDEFYGIVLTDDARDAALDLAVAAWTEQRRKLFGVSNDLAAMLTGTGINQTLNTLNLSRTFTFYRSVTDEYPEAAFFGRMLTVDFTGVNTARTGKFKSLSGITIESLTQNEFDLLQKLASTEPGPVSNVHARVAGVSMVFDGVMASGEFFDTMHGIDWLHAEIQTRVLAALVGNDKIPYTNRGVGTLVNQVRGALQQGVANGLLAPVFSADGSEIEAPAFEITVPSVLDVSASQRAARQGPSITWTARLAGAVHFATTNGTITV
jgi:hypothetical protein